MPLSGKLSWKGDAVTRRVQTAGVRGVNKALEKLRGDAVNVTPLGVTGNLRGSAAVNPASADGLGGSVTFDTVYAARQHEELGWHHDEGQARYLAGPLEENAQVYGGIIAAEVRRVL